MHRLILTMASIGLLGVALAPNAPADEWNKLTVLTVNQPIQVPNKVLPPGKYIIKLLNSQSDRHIVEIYNANQSKILDTVMAIPNYRLQPTGKTAFTFWETPPGQPRALRAWFYPGDNFGQEFAYPKTAAAQIAAVTHQNVPTTEPSQYNNAQVTETAPPPQQEAQATPPPQPEAQETQPQQQIAQATPPPQPQAAPAPQELPKTASPYPLIGLAGIFSLGLFALVRAYRLS
jgi:hypothetical protein